MSSDRRGLTFCRGRERGLALPRSLGLGPAALIRVQLERRPAGVGSLGPSLYRGQIHPFSLHRPRPGTLLVHWKNIGDFFIKRRSGHITAQPAPDVPFGRFRDLLLTAINSFALLERGVETLHGSGVARGGGAVAFLGGPSSGKSTLAAFFARRGASVLTDDLLAVQQRRACLLAYPTTPEIKLAPPAARAVGLLPERLPRVEPRHPKRLWTAPATRRPRLLAAFYFPRLVSPRSKVRLVRLSPRAAFRALLASSFNATLQTRGRMRRQFRLFSRLAQRVPARRLLIPRDWRRLGEAGEIIERDLAALPR